MDNSTGIPPVIAPPAATDTARPPCRHWIGPEHRRCLTVEDVDQYLTGWRCPDHTPARIAGRPEPQPGPGYTPQDIPSPLGASAVFDERAVASGKRRSSPHVYAAARAAVHGEGAA